MKLIEKIRAKQDDLFGAPSVTIAFLGDSVTQGCFECSMNGTKIETVYESRNSFSEKVKQIFGLLYPTVQVNIINSGIGGDSALNGLARFDRDITPFSPDLVVVGYGLNDSGAGLDGITRYTDALNGIFQKIDALGAEAIFLTPNMMNTNVSPSLTDEFLRNLAKNFAVTQNAGILDRYVDAAREVAAQNGVRVCDIYKKWKTMSSCGVNVTEMLANRLNHPVRELHWMTAYSLIEMIFKE